MQEKIRVLQVTGGMNVGGAETWLMHVLRRIDRERFHFDFLVFDESEQVFEAEILSLGGRIVRCPIPSANPQSLRTCFSVIRQNGPYDVMHCHLQHYSGLILGLGKLARVPIRIAQSHFNSSPAKATSSRLHRAYFRVMESLIDITSTDKWAVSDLAGTSLFGDHWLQLPSSRIVHSGIDLEPFTNHGSKILTRNELGLRPDSWVIGHVGRFHPPKNHEFIIDIALDIAATGENVQFLLLGDGPLRTRIETVAELHGVKDLFVFAGVRLDVPDIMLNAMDMFVFPSKYEGLGLVGLEAQAAGLPSIFSITCPREIAVVEGLYEFLPIDDPKPWANRVREIQNSPLMVTKGTALAQIVRSPFNIEGIVSDIELLYSGKHPELGC